MQPLFYYTHGFWLVRNLGKIQHRWHISALWGDSKSGGWNLLEASSLTAGWCWLSAGPQLGCPSGHIPAASLYGLREASSQNSGWDRVWAFQESNTEVYAIAWSSLRSHIWSLLLHTLAWGSHVVAQVQGGET